MMMMMQQASDAVETAGGYVHRFISNPTVIATILIAIFGQVTASIYFQITNNERQEQAINRNSEQLKELRETIFSQQTPLAQRVIKLEDRIDEAANRIIFVQRQNERDLVALKEQQERILGAVDNLYAAVTGVPILKRNNKPQPEPEKKK